MNQKSRPLPLARYQPGIRESITPTCKRRRACVGSVRGRARPWHAHAGATALLTRRPRAHGHAQGSRAARTRVNNTTANLEAAAALNSSTGANAADRPPVPRSRSCSWEAMWFAATTLASASPARCVPHSSLTRRERRACSWLLAASALRAASLTRPLPSAAQIIVLRSCTVVASCTEPVRRER